MDIFKRERMTQWIIVLLVILNLFTMATLWVQRGKDQPLPLPPGDERRQGHGVLEFLEMELDLSEDQTQRLEALRSRHHEERFQTEKLMLDKRREYMRLVTENNPDTAKVNRLARQLGEIQAKMEGLTFQHFTEIKALCTPEQKDQFNRLMREVLDRQPPPGHRPEGRRRPPPRRRPR